MTVYPITLNLPETLYQQLSRAAELVQKPVHNLLIESITAVAPVINSTSKNLRSSLAQMAYLNDAALWQAARTTMTTGQQERLEALHLKQQREGLTAGERTEEQALLTLYHETLLVKAQAAVLLKQRKYDVSDPRQFHSLV